MAIKYGFFDSVNGDRKYNADDISNYFLKLISNGVFATPSDAMQVQSGTGMTVSVSAGWGFINCKWINNDSPYNLKLDASDVVLNRYDRVVLRLDATTSSRNITIVVKKGVVSENPIPPALMRVKGGVWELSLAKIFVAAGTTTINQRDITDERSNSDVCGWVTGLIDQIDTTNLFAQYDDAFNEWFKDVKETLTTTTLIRQFTSSYKTTTENETVIPINIPNYSISLDVLNVYVAGRKFIENVDYVKSATYITLKRPLDVIGTSIEFEVLKSIDGSEAESIVDIVYQMQLEIGKTDRNVYFCNGVNDNVGLMNYITEWEKGQTTKDIIQIVGSFGINTTTHTASNNKKYSIVYECERNCGATLDFSSCDIINAPVTNFAYFSGCTVKGLTLMYNNVVQIDNITCLAGKNAKLEKCLVHGSLAGTTTVFAFDFDNSRLNECDVKLSNIGDIWGIRGTGVTNLNSCDVDVITTGASKTAYGIFISPSSHGTDCRSRATGSGTGGSARGGHNGGHFVNCDFVGIGTASGTGFFTGSTSIMVADNCVFRGYSKGTNSGHGVNGSGIAFLNNIVCNSVPETGYSQHESMYFQTGQGNFSGVFYKEPNVPETLKSNGHVIANIS